MDALQIPTLRTLVLEFLHLDNRMIASVSRYLRSVRFSSLRGLLL